MAKVAARSTETYIVATVSRESLAKLNELVGEHGYQRSYLLRSWVDDFIAERDFRLPCMPGRADWPGQSGGRASHRVAFYVPIAAKGEFRARASQLGVPQTTLLRSWIEAFCDATGASRSGRPVSARAHGPKLGKAVMPKVPAELKASFGALCRKAGRNPNKVVEGWLLALASGDLAAVPPIDCADVAPIEGARATQSLSGIYLRLPDEARAKAEAAIGAQGREMHAAVALWMQACARAKSCLPAELHRAEGGGRAAAPGNPSAGKRGTAFHCQLSPALKEAFIAKCGREGRVPAMLLRAWLAAHLHGRPWELPKPAMGAEAPSERAAAFATAKVGVDIAKRDLRAFKAVAEGRSMSRLVRGWIRGYVLLDGVADPSAA